MKILLSHRYFWPDTAPYAFLLRAIGEDLSAAGHEVHVFASKPSYRKGYDENVPKREKLGPLHLSRCWVFQEEGAVAFIRAANVFLYCISLFFRVLTLRPDIVTAGTFPPILAGYAGSLAAKLTGAKFIYHMQDIHPEVSEISGGFMGRGILAKLFRWLDNQTLRRCAAIVVLSEDMAATLQARDLGDLPIHVINNFALDDGSELKAPPSEYAKPRGKRRVIFAGNLGRFQNLPVLAEGVATCFEAHTDLELFFLGSGKAEAELKAKWNDHPQVTFAPFLPLEQAKPLIAEAEVGLVSLSKDVYKVAYPSKILTYLGLGVPVLTLTEPESVLSRRLSEAGVAMAPPSADARDIGATLETLLDRSISHKDVISWYNATFSRDLSSKKWSQIVANIESH